MQTARHFLERMSNLSVKIDKHHRMLVCAAALLHDVGHGPFSHAFEKVTSDSHERRALEIINDDSTEIVFGNRETSDFWVDGLRVWWLQVKGS